MNSYQLGHSELNISRLGLGCMGMSEFYGPSDEAECIKTLHAALDLGITFYDTADMYGRGENEELLARAFANRWDDIVLATKFGVLRNDDGGFAGVCGKPDYVRQACDNSLKRLGRDTIDLYYAHRIDPAVPVEETVGAMKDLVNAGKVRYIGLSEATAEQVRKAHAIHPLTALQSEYSLWSREPEGEILNTCRELGIAFVSYSPLGRGFLTGTISRQSDLDESDWRRHNPRFQQDVMDKNKAYLTLIKEIAAAKHISPAQVALGWVLNQGENIFPIPGTRHIDRLKENLGALQVSFSEDELKELRSRLPETIGDRYP
jgi:aryl-alcohol dehydrogenase-like predicted oxidoreductase